MHGFSKWVMMNQDTRRLQKVTDDPNNSILRKIAKLEDPAQYSRLGLVNMPQELIDSHELQTITLDYRGECQQMTYSRFPY
ncbi:oleoyl-acyl carrier protein thioesterase 1 [Pyrus ussuriensis x Pyrus communis]|uniref:Oleoyl-acyl carrier protein thioesterase 1 n=1 Tax=Pyrus ussuriensis x Pyrus communis TaxID=2448454 RepID=A0A5N5FGY0_9ROSA|nr:oleoyl-acyl carrier protein thioesterase 1 [Pyrus ussuriensis x Pyrus communis]